MSVVFKDGSAHCSESNCHQLDFLPFICEKCHRVYCLQHRSSEQHSCNFSLEQVRVSPSCPVCSHTIFVRADEDPNAIMAMHLDSRCQSRLMSEIQRESKREKSKATHCHFCSNKDSLMTLVCQKCTLQFCVKHRFPADHACTPPPPPYSLMASLTGAAPEKHSKGKALMERLKAEREAKAAAAAASSSSSSSSSAASSAAARARASKTRHQQTTTLQMIRQGMSSVGSTALNAVSAVTDAVGLTSSASSDSIASSSSSTASSSSSLPSLTLPSAAELRAVQQQAKDHGQASLSESERLYLRIIGHAVKHTENAPCVFIKKTHTVGRAMDSICDLIGVVNNNHLSSITEKLVLCAASTGLPLPTDIPMNLLSPLVVNGGSIRLDRVPRAPSPAPSAIADASASSS